ncbi:hypothetical protein ACQEVZ_60600 [Dactylosporangium sp. CA-152071]|uniref:hypothetical protein n=1 Tax=Dactylosporangium sp. CA-152071 TaxID=3239933 RepID=UPI003D8D2258
MKTATRGHLRVVVTPEIAAGQQVPAGLWRRAAQHDWATCDVCRLPVDPAGVIPEQPQRHLSCVCEACNAPLGADDVRWHPQCRPTDPVRNLRLIGRRP